MQTLLAESELARAMALPEARNRLGRLPGGDVWAHLRRDADGGGWRVDLVRGASGELLAPEPFAGESARLGPFVAGLLGALPGGEEKRRVVVADFPARWPGGARRAGGPPPLAGCRGPRPARAAQIPAHLQTPLQGRAFAEQWAREEKAGVAARR